MQILWENTSNAKETLSSLLEIMQQMWKAKPFSYCLYVIKNGGTNFQTTGEIQKSDERIQD